VIDLAGAGGGLAIGILIALLLEFRDKSLKVESDVRAALALPVLGMIPLMVSVSERRRNRWRRAGVSLGLATVFVLCATAMWITFRI
jgi:hypothetical protein